MSIDSISRNATNLWQLMNEGSTWTYHKLKQTTRLSDREIDTALGWLAREDTLEIIADSISDEETYKVRHFWELEGFLL